MGFLYACAAVANTPPTVPAERTLDVDVNDTARHRVIPVRIYLPNTANSSPLILFSHGLGGNRAGYRYLAESWSAHGYVVVMLQHPGSDWDAISNTPLLERRGALEGAANVANFLLRVGDVHRVIDALTEMNQDASSPVYGRLDLKRIGMAGHSFGAITTQAVSGQVFRTGTSNLTDPRIRAAIALSPSPPMADSAEHAFKKVSIPWLLMTGTKDVALIGHTTVESRLSVFEALPPGDKFELVLDQAEHSAFTDRALPGDKMPRNPSHHRIIQQISLAFWDAYLRGAPDETRWLKSTEPRALLETKDIWKWK